MPTWAPTLLTAAGLVVLWAVHLVVLGRMIGRFERELKNQGDRLTDHKAQTAADLAEIKTRVSEMEDEVEGETGFRAQLEQRVVQVEKAAEAFWTVRDLITAMRAAGEVEDRHNREKLESLSRSVAVIERQMGTLVSKGLEFKTP